MLRFNPVFLITSMSLRSVVPAGAGSAVRGLATKARAVTFSKYGEPQDVISVQSYNLGELGPEDVLVKTLASPINPSDVNQVQGVYPSRPVFTKLFGEPDTAIGGNEGLFEVLEVGKDVTGLKSGDWTVPAILSFGTWRSHALVNYKSLTPALPKLGADPVMLATSNINPVSAYQMLRNYVELKPGDWFIQNGGNSAVGRAAIQIAKKMGVKSISVVRSRDNIEELIAELKALGADEVITEEQSGSKEFSETIKGWVDGKLKLALNCVGGKSATSIARHLSPNGHHVTYGAMSKQPVMVPTGLFIFSNITFHGFWLSRNAKEDPKSRTRDLGEIFKMIAAGELQGVPAHEHKLSESNSDEENSKVAHDAFAAYEKGFSNKKHVFVYE